MKLQSDEMVANWIKEEANPAIEKLTKINLEVVEQIAITLIEKGLSVDEFSRLIDIAPLEVSKWLKGNHNFSERTLNEIQETLRN